MGMERRSFIKTSCALCLSASVGGLLSSMMSSCASIPIYTTTSIKDTIKVPASIFASTDIQIIHADNYEYDIALKKEADGSFLALVLQCTHASNPLTMAGDKFKCSLHGSTFNKQGAVTHGPAEYPLKRLTTKLSKSDIIVILKS
jgi:Rieske Fe-S protein